MKRFAGCGMRDKISQLQAYETQGRLFRPRQHADRQRWISRRSRKVQLIDGAADAIARVKSLGYLAIIFSNQSGVARGMFEESAVQAVNAKLDEMLKSQNPAAVIDRHEYCPFHPEASLSAIARTVNCASLRPA
jgi:histidinol phosphatase-like enzyme